MNRVFICGDTHGTFDVGKLESLRTTKNLCYDDYLNVYNKSYSFCKN